MMLAAWGTFFQGELGAAAALAGLLFVSLSVNQTKILELGRMADRGLEALAILFLVIMVSSLPLIPGQSIRLLGGEILVLGAGAMAATALLQRSYLRHTDEAYLRGTMRMVRTNRIAVGTNCPGRTAAAVEGRCGRALYYASRNTSVVPCSGGECMGFADRD
jgi:hypothetical protein